MYYAIEKTDVLQGVEVVASNSINEKKKEQ